MMIISTRFIRIFFLALIAVFFSSCDELKEKTKQSLEVDANKVNFEVDSTSFNAQKSTNATIVVLDTTINVDVAGVLEDNGYSTDNLSEAQITQAVLTIEEPDVPLDFITSATLRIGEAGGETEMVAQTTNIAQGSRTVELETFNDNILQYLEVNPLRAVLEVQSDEPLPADVIEMSLNSSYEVTVEVL